MLSIDEAIEHAKKKSEDMRCSESCRSEHRQLVEWLQELVIARRRTSELAIGNEELGIEIDKLRKENSSYEDEIEGLQWLVREYRRKQEVKAPNKAYREWSDKMNEEIEKMKEGKFKCYPPIGTPIGHWKNPSIGNSADTDGDLPRETPAPALRVKLDDGAPALSYARPGDAGMDLTSRADVAIIPPHSICMVGTGVHVEIPEGCFGMVVPRSGMTVNQGVTLANCVGIIDSGYRGEIKAPLYNLMPYEVEVKKGTRICQLVIVPFLQVSPVVVDELSESERGENGFGSTGIC